MPEKLKNLFFTRESLNRFADSIKQHFPAFDREKFLKLIFDDNWESLELKGKMHHATKCLRQCLPEDYIESLVILVKAAPFVKGFESMSLPDYVEIYGMDHWEESLNALGHFTQYTSSEFAIRPYLDRNPDLVMHYMNKWAESKHENVRRFASEGCRPRLPWAMVLPKFIVNPAPVIEVLEKLKDDTSEFVRKSVANNLNDISKDNPEIVLDVCEQWYGHSAATDQIVKQACRTLLKQGNIRAMRLFGFGDPDKLKIDHLKLSKNKLKIGEVLQFSFELVNLENMECKVRLEYGMDYMKANGKHSRKIFQILEKLYLPGKYVLKRKHSFEDMSTRKHYPGIHKMSLIVNGITKAVAEIELY